MGSPDSDWNLLSIGDTSTGASQPFPDVALTGSIPHLRPQEIPQAFLTSKYETGDGLFLGELLTMIGGGGAFTRLFDSGDASPLGPEYSNVEQFESALLCDTFRAAIWVSDFLVYQNEHGIPVGASCRWWDRVGDTPFRTSAVHPSAPISLTVHCFPGASLVGPDFGAPRLRQDTLDTFTLEFEYQFILCEWMDIAQWFFTRHRAPFAWMRLEYSVRLNRKLGPAYAIRLDGSFIPTQRPYVAWKRLDRYQHDMRLITQHQAEGFIEAGERRLAPQRPTSIRFAGSLVL